MKLNEEDIKRLSEFIASDGSNFDIKMIIEALQELSENYIKMFEILLSFFDRNPELFEKMLEQKMDEKIYPVYNNI